MAVNQLKGKAASSTDSRQRQVREFEMRQGRGGGFGLPGGLYQAGEVNNRESEWAAVMSGGFRMVRRQKETELSLAAVE
ncbi:hypothetical protein N7462_005328 [Penicillium macrosclerotiorum]|uniref:uncharacterized protein n=1 Tax=Penicillium macrosclerotiorum TaxID=303699 RepID=UPI002547B89A|nr:uncharacterized protein N7462_005328 [Penicillium macrosclerotiorum]KAJ5682163.1 hypothetical protein N7462_005328 [Penicillium macrosclerotiorum]